MTVSVYRKEGEPKFCVGKDKIPGEGQDRII
jgi:hypothetical protein